MIGIHFLFDYFSRADTIEYRSTKLAVFRNSDTGPGVWFNESTDHELDSDPFFLENFALATMISATQGNNYQDEVMLLPVAKFSNYHALVASIVFPGENPIHERYYQFCLFVPNDVVIHLPNILELRTEILRVINRKIYMIDLSDHLMSNLKLKLLSILQEFVS